MCARALTLQVVSPHKYSGQAALEAEHSQWFGNQHTVLPFLIFSFTFPLRLSAFFQVSAAQLSPSAINPSYERMINWTYLKFNRCLGQLYLCCAAFFWDFPFHLLSGANGFQWLCFQLSLVISAFLLGKGQLGRKSILTEVGAPDTPDLSCLHV